MLLSILCIAMLSVSVSAALKTFQCNVFVRMYNPNNPPGCTGSQCFNRAYTCKYAPPDLNTYYLTGLSYVAPFLCPNGATNPTISFMATVADGTQAGLFINAFSSYSPTGAQNALNMVNKYMPHAPCGASLVADATACGSDTFTWDWTNLPQGIQSCAPPSPNPPPPPPPVVPTSCNVYVRMYNSANIYCPDPTKCFNASTCTSAPFNLNNFYLSGLSYVSGFNCPFGVTNPTISFLAVMSSPAEALNFITGFSSANTNGANYATFMVNTFMAGAPCDATYIADAGQCNSGFFQWDKLNLPALSCNRPPPPPSPPPPVVPTSCNVYVRMYNSANIYCPDPSKCFNANTCTSAPLNLNNFYLPGISYVSTFSCSFGVTNPTISFTAVLSSGNEAVKFMLGFGSGGANGANYATFMVNTFMAGAPCDSTYVADASQCGAGLFSWDSYTLPSVLSCKVPTPPPPPPPPVTPSCTVYVQMFNPNNANCYDPNTSCFNQNTCNQVPGQLAAFYLPGVSSSPFSCPSYGATNPIITFSAQMSSYSDGAKFILNFNSSSPSGAYYASVIIPSWMPNAPCTATYSADATSCGAGKFTWNQYNLPQTIPPCSATVPPPPPPPPSVLPSPPPTPPPLPPGSTGFDKLFFTSVVAPSAITCRQVVAAMVAFLKLAKNPYLGPNCTAVKPTELAITTYFATMQAGDHFMAVLQSYSSDFILLTNLPCGSFLTFYWAATTNMFSCSIFYPSLCCYNNPPKPPGLSSPPPPPPPASTPLNILREIAVVTPKTTAAGYVITAQYVVNFLCPPLATAAKAMFIDLGIGGQDWDPASVCLITNQSKSWRCALAFKMTQYASELIEVYLDNEETLNLFVQRGAVFCSSKLSLIDGTSNSIILVKKSPEAYPLNPASFKSHCIREPSSVKAVKG